MNGGGIVRAVGVAMLAGLAACVADTGVPSGDDGRDDAFLTPGSADGTGVSEGSVEGCTVLRVANEATLEELDVDAELDARAARGILARRPFATLAALDAVPYVGLVAFEKMLAWGDANELACEPPPDEPATCTATGGTYDGVAFTREEECDAVAFANRARYSDMRRLTDVGRRVVYDRCPANPCSSYRSSRWTSMREIAQHDGVSATTVRAIRDSAAVWEEASVWHDTVADTWSRRSSLRDAPITFEKVYVTRSLGTVSDGGYRWACVEVRDSPRSTNHLPACLRWIVADHATDCTASAPRCMDDLVGRWVWLRGKLAGSHLPGGYQLAVESSGGREANPSLLVSGEFEDPTCTTTWCATTLANAPALRSTHVTVWTGREMIVWSGVTGATTRGDGGRYDPATGTWRAVSTTGAPWARKWASAAWTGREMIVWGGVAADPPAYEPRLLRDGGRYDPQTDTWRSMSTTNAPTPRSRPSVVWTGRELIVWGGVAFDGTWRNDGARYDPAMNRWRSMSIAGAPSPRAFASAVWTGTEMIVWGGLAEDPFADGARYDPATNTWRAMSSTGAPSPRTEAAAVWTGREMIVWGGRSQTPAPDSIIGFLSDGARYDPELDRWYAIASSDVAPAAASASAVWSGAEMIVLGGYSHGTPLPRGAAYDPATGAWSSLPIQLTPGPRRDGSMIWTGTEVVVWGGEMNENQPLASGARLAR